MEFTDIFPVRLKSARKMARLSMDELVDKIGHVVSKSAINKYEHGQMLPDSKILIELAKALGVSIDYFFKPINLRLGNVEFRKRTKLGNPEQEQIKEKALEYLERYIDLEDILNQRIEFNNPITNTKISGQQHIEEVAIEFRKSLNIGDSPIVNVLDLLESYGFKIIEFESSSSFDGLSAWVGSIPLIVLNKNVDAERKRFTALHEVAHLILTFDESIADNDIEKLCHSFAGAVLIPKHVFKKEFGNHRDNIPLIELLDVNSIFGISVQALIKRAEALGILTQKQVRTFFIKCNTLETYKAAKQSHYNGTEKATRFQHLIYYAATEEIISLNKAANLAGVGLHEFRAQLQ